jgi:hypothetical protein
MRISGVDTGKAGTLWADKLDKAKRHRTAGQTQLEARNDLIRAVQPGDTVIAADPLCLGVSPHDGGWFLSEMAERGVTVVVHRDLHHVEPGAATDHVIAEFARLLNNFNAAKSRGRI